MAFVSTYFVGFNFVRLDLNNASKFQTIIKCDIISEKERNFEETN